MELFDERHKLTLTDLLMSRKDMNLFIMNRESEDYRKSCLLLIDKVRTKDQTYK